MKIRSALLSLSLMAPIAVYAKTMPARAEDTVKTPDGRRITLTRKHVQINFNGERKDESDIVITYVAADLNPEQIKKDAEVIKNKFLAEADKIGATGIVIQAQSKSRKVGERSEFNAVAATFTIKKGERWQPSSTK